MSKLLNAVGQRFQELETGESFQDSDGKTLSARVSREMFDKVETVASILQMSKSDFLRMVISNAVDDIIEKYQISFSSYGMTPSELDDFMKLPIERKKELLKQWEGESEN